jgi:hypothetical protein
MMMPAPPPCSRPLRASLALPVLALSLLLAGCEDSKAPATAVTPPTTVSTPTPAPTQTGFDVTPCLNQIAAPGRTVANLVLPDLINLDLTRPPGFPNGRLYLDPVIDITLAAVFLDLRRHPATTLAAIPLNPNDVDQPLSPTFPFLAPALGAPPTSGGAGSNFTFRSDPVAAYVRVDRMAMPAVATALITGNANKNAYNDDNPLIDASGKWVAEIGGTLTFLTNALADDLIALGLTPCAKAF